MKNRIQLGDIAKIYSGGTPSRTKPEYWGGEIPWVKTTQIQNCIINRDDVDEWISEEGLKKSSAKMVPEGTILMAMYGQGKTRGQVAILSLKASINQACAAIELSPKGHRDFIYQQLLFRYVAIRNMSNTGGQENLSSGLIKEISISLPPLEEQKAIAEVLSTWDRAISTTERLIQAKEKRYYQLASTLLFGKNSTTETQGTRFFQYPKNWNLLHIHEFAEEVSERNSNPEATVLSCSKYDGFVNSLDYFGKKVFSDDTSNYKVIQKDQFGFPANHIEEGSIGLLEHCESGILSPIYVVFRIPKKTVVPQFLIRLLKTNTFRHIFEVSTSASVNRRGSLRWKEFSKIKVALPPLDEQTAIAETLNAAQREIDLLKKLADKYKEQKRGLMQKLLTGTWRVM